MFNVQADHTTNRQEQRGQEHLGSSTDKKKNRLADENHGELYWLNLGSLKECEREKTNM